MQVPNLDREAIIHIFVNYQYHYSALFSVDLYAHEKIFG